MELNAEQRRAVAHTSGPLLVLAGAGTGKTRVITERYLRLVHDEKIPVHQILAVTFTHKAADEMLERVLPDLPVGAFDMWITTFHGLCERMLREHAHRVGWSPHFTVMDESAQRLFLQQHLRELGLRELSPAYRPTQYLSEIMTHFSRLQDEGIYPEQYLRWVAESSPEAGTFHELASACNAYSQLKLQSGVVDFGDLLTGAVRLLQNHPSVRAVYHDIFRHIIVDEFQDTNRIQFQLVQLLSAPPHNLMVVADDDQSIYRWRGAATENIADFASRYPELVTVSLVRNYRSAQPILDAAYTLITHNNPDRLECSLGISKKLFGEPHLSGSVIIFESTTQHEEISFIVREIQHLVDEGYQYRDIAILFRAHGHGDALYHALHDAGVPVQSAQSHVRRDPLITDILSFLTVVTNPGEHHALVRLLSLPTWGLSGKDVAELTHWARDETIRLFDAVLRGEECSFLSSEGRAACVKVAEMFAWSHATPLHTVGEVSLYFLKETGRYHELVNAQGSNALGTAEAVQQFFDAVKTFERVAQWGSVGEFLEFYQQSNVPQEDDEVDAEGNAVSLLTVHAAKGLEYPVVFIINLIQSRFPSARRSDPFPLPSELLPGGSAEHDPRLAHVQEERRLFYVALTRTRERVYLTYAQRYDGNKTKRPRSVFVDEVFASGVTKVHVAVEPEGEEARGLRLIPDSVADRITLSAPDIGSISYSQLDTFRRCPLQYRFKYVLHIPEKPSAELSFGTSIHTALYEYFRDLQEGIAVNLPYLQALYEKAWISKGYFDAVSEAQKKAEGVLMLEQFYALHGRPKRSPLLLEQPFTISLNDVTVSGKIDRIDVSEEGVVTVIDYKTSKPPTQKEVDESLQLSIYAIAVLRSNWVKASPKTLRLGLLNMRDGKFYETTRTEDDLAACEREILSIVQDMRESSFPPLVSRSCEYCGFQALCDAYQQSVAQ